MIVWMVFFSDAIVFCVRFLFEVKNIGKKQDFP